MASTEGWRMRHNSAKHRDTQAQQMSSLPSWTRECQVLGSCKATVHARLLRNAAELRARLGREACNLSTAGSAFFQTSKPVGALLEGCFW